MSKTLIITCSGGNGHLQAAKALESIWGETALSQDLLLDLFGPPFGKAFVHIWNRAQHKGHTRLLYFFGTRLVAYMVDALIAPFVFFRLLKLLKLHPIERIIDVQPWGTAAAIYAIRWSKKTDLHLEKRLIECPTPKALAYLFPIKKLSKKNRSYLKLITIPPILPSGESDASFWKAQTNLPLAQITYEPLPLRPAFYRPAPSPLLSVPSPRHRYLLETFVPSLKKEGEHFCLDLAPHEQLITLMLGSQPTPLSALSYVKQIVDLSRNKPVVLVVCCAHQSSENTCLLEKICALIQKLPPSSIPVIPIPYQEDEVVAFLYQRSCATLTRSGGLTAMELLATSKGKMWIHTRSTKGWGMPMWEEGNADYLTRKRGAQVVSPETFTQITASFFDSL